MNGRQTGWEGTNRGRQGQPGANSQQRDSDMLINEIIKKIPEILDKNRDAGGDELVTCAEKLGQYLKQKNMTTSQVRNLFMAAKRTTSSANWQYEKNLLRAKFAYHAGRFKEIKDFQKVADKALQEIKTQEQYSRFIDFFEAVVAYHKAYGGRE